MSSSPPLFYRSSERYFLRIDSLIFSISLEIFSCSRTSATFMLRHDWSRYGIANSLNSFLYRPFVNALSLSITRNPYFCCQQFSRHNAQNSSYEFCIRTCRYLHDHCKRVSSWSCLNRMEQDQIRVVAYQMLGILVYV